MPFSSFKKQRLKQFATYSGKAKGLNLSRVQLILCIKELNKKKSEAISCFLKQPEMLVVIFYLIKPESLRMFYLCREVI